ncbi:TPA: hypothetical protein ACYUXQ_004145 [Escherichia coli]
MRSNIRFFFVALLFLCFKSIGAWRYCNILWVNKELPSINAINVDIDGNTNLDIPLEIHAGGISQATNVVSNIPDKLNISSLSGTFRYWFQFPSGWLTSPEGLRYKISSEYDDADSQTPGFKTVVTPLLTKNWSGIVCKTEDTHFPKTSSNRFTLHIDRAFAFPGRYNLTLPIKSAYEENKGHYDGPAEDGWRNYATIMKSYPTIDTKNIDISVRSSCNISTKNIHIDYGNINANDALAGVRKNASFNISCSAPTRVQLEIDGGNIEGVKNKTSCGDGICTLTFPSGKANETLIFPSAGNKAVTIESLFKTNKITAGIFSGALVVRMEIL